VVGLLGERRGQDNQLLHDRGTGGARDRARAGDETDITHVPMYLRARNYGISYLPRSHRSFAKLTVEENILAVLEAQPLGSRDGARGLKRLITS